MGLHTDIAMSLKKLLAVCTEHGNKRDPVDHDSLSDTFLCCRGRGNWGKESVILLGWDSFNKVHSSRQTRQAEDDSRIGRGAKATDRQDDHGIHQTQSYISKTVTVKGKVLVQQTGQLVC